MGTSEKWKSAYDQLELMKKMIKLKKELIDIQEKQVRNYNAYHSFQKIMKLEDIMQFAEDSLQNNAEGS